jgi:hypothetical protein
MVFGEGVRMPSYNVAGTFFGIGQMRLPTANFPRFILMLFILFCLIFRTAYQGVFYEMMTTDMRKPAPKSIIDLYEGNYSMIVPYTFDQFNHISGDLGRLNESYPGIDER